MNTSEQIPDPRPGNYYVSATDAGRYWLMSGPYPSHHAALDAVNRVQTFACEIDRKGVWYAWGTARLADDQPAKLGVLEERVPNWSKQ